MFNLFLRFIFLVFINSLFWFFVFRVSGFLFYYIGFKRFGVRLVAYSIAGDFGFDKFARKWLKNHCPSNECIKCTLWTCDNYHNRS